jgi:hypothetical protein
VAWVPVGVATASTGVWKSVGLCSADLIRVSYTMGEASRPPLGVLRQAWQTEGPQGPLTYDGYWVRLYPKTTEFELYRIPVPPEFEAIGLVQREIQIRAWSAWTWTITVEQWL